MTGVERYVTYMPMIEASTRYLRDFVDSRLPAAALRHQITTDMMGETQQRVKRVGELQEEAQRTFHILDSVARTPGARRGNRAAGRHSLRSAAVAAMVTERREHLRLRELVAVGRPALQRRRWLRL
jgi:hypothetical protein